MNDGGSADGLLFLRFAIFLHQERDEWRFRCWFYGSWNVSASIDFDWPKRNVAN